MDWNNYEMSKKRYAHNCLCLRQRTQQKQRRKLVNSTASGEKPPVINSDNCLRATEFSSGHSAGKQLFFVTRRRKPRQRNHVAAAKESWCSAGRRSLLGYRFLFHKMPPLRPIRRRSIRSVKAIFAEQSQTAWGNGNRHDRSSLSPIRAFCLIHFAL